MRRVLLSVAAAATLVAGLVPASAQYVGGYAGDGPPPPGFGRPYRGYDPDDRPPPPRYGRPDYDRGPGYGYGYGGRPRIGGTCVTSRGACPSVPSPVGAPCRCEIPGFGLKRGNVVR